MSGLVVYQPISPPNLLPIDVARFASRVDISGGRLACHPWLGAIGPNGYGRTQQANRSVLAHRFALELRLRRPIRPGYFACHTCDNKVCVNGLHLYEGSAADNNRDMHDRRRDGTHTRPDRVLRGERVGTAVLTAEAVGEIRRLAATGLSSSRLGSAYGVSSSTIRLIVSRKAWGHVP